MAQHLPHRLTRLSAPTLRVDENNKIELVRGHVREDVVRLGPNTVHIGIIHPDGTYEDVGVSANLMTVVGRDLLAAAIGHSTQKTGAFTATSATSGTPSGGGMTTDQYKGWRVYSPITGITTVPVYGNIGSNSATVLTVDQWWTGTDTVGTTPASTNAYAVYPSFSPRFIGVTTDAAAAASGDTVLASEQTGNGLGRAIGTYAHTPAASTFTLQKLFGVTGTVASLHKAGLFTAMNTTAAGVLCFETVADADKSVINGDIYSVTWTVTLTG